VYRRESARERKGRGYAYISKYVTKGEGRLKSSMQGRGRVAKHGAIERCGQGTGSIQLTG
jgi:hypothetical protein